MDGGKPGAILQGPQTAAQLAALFDRHENSRGLWHRRGIRIYPRAAVHLRLDRGPGKFQEPLTLRVGHHHEVSTSGSNVPNAAAR